MYIEVILCLGAVLLLVHLGHRLRRTLWSPAPWAPSALAVIPAQGDGDQLEQAVKGLLWLRSSHQAGLSILIADAGLNPGGQHLAQLLAKDHEVLLCPLEEVPAFLGQMVKDDFADSR